MGIYTDAGAAADAQIDDLKRQLDMLVAQSDRDDATIAALTSEVARLQAIIDAATPPPTSYLLPWGYSYDRRVRLETESGATTTCERTYDQPGMHGDGVPAAMSATHIMQTPAGYLPVYSFKTADWIAAANPTGSQAKDFEAFVRSCTRDVIVIPNHEPENDGRGTVSGKTQATAFRDMITNYGLIVKRVGNPKVRLAINLMEWWIENIGSGGTENSEKYIPLGANKDFPLIISWDGYQTSATTTLASVWDAAAALSAKYGSAFAIGETGTTVDASKWVVACSDYAASKKAAFACYWPSQVSATSNQYYPLPKDMPAFKAVALKYGGKAL